MASELSFVKYIADGLSQLGDVVYKKLFGEYAIYIEKTLIYLVCDDTVFVKIDAVLDSVLSPSTPKAAPYPGAKLYYVLDPDDVELLRSVAQAKLDRREG